MVQDDVGGEGGVAGGVLVEGSFRVDGGCRGVVGVVLGVEVGRDVSAGEGGMVSVGPGVRFAR